MKKKDTSVLVEELKNCEDFKKFHAAAEKYSNDGTSLADALSGVIAESGMSKTEIIKNSTISEIYAYQIFSGTRRPERGKLLALTVAAHLDLDATQRLLKTTGYPELYVKNTFDSVVMYGICNKMSVIEINALLFEYGCRTLG